MTQTIRGCYKYRYETIRFAYFTGGLGPTYDDMTKEVVAKTLGIKLILNNSIEENIKKIF